MSGLKAGWNGGCGAKLMPSANLPAGGGTLLVESRGRFACWRNTYGREPRVTSAACVAVAAVGERTSDGISREATQNTTGKGRNKRKKREKKIDRPNERMGERETKSVRRRKKRENPRFQMEERRSARGGLRKFDTQDVTEPQGRPIEGPPPPPPLVPNTRTDNAR